ncbi:75_t:CDS:2, partial [Racocetra persica]
NDYFYSDELDFAKAQKFKKKYHNKLFSEYSFFELKTINTEEKYQKLISIAASLKMSYHPIESNLPIIMEKTISGSCASGKSSVGYLLATKLNYQFIETDLFYQYLASKTSSFDEEELINILNNEEPKHLFQIDNTTLYEKDNDIKKRAFELSKNVNIRKKISEIIQKNMKKKGFVVVGCDSTTDILPDAEIKLYLIANFETRVDHRQKQFNSENLIWLDIITRNSSLIKKAQKISDNIDITYLEILEVVDLILKNVFY